MEIYATRRPNPVRLRRTLQFTEVDLHRRVACRNYYGCLDHAVTRAWLSFTCVRCFAFHPRFEPDDGRDGMGIVARGLANRVFPTVALYLSYRRAPEQY